MTLRVCIEPGCPELGTTTRCPTHTRARNRTLGTRQERGYGVTHERVRAKWAPKVASGQVNCARCGERISPLEQWHLDHTDDRSGYLGPSHARCNTTAPHLTSPGA